VTRRQLASTLSVQLYLQIKNLVYVHAAPYLADALLTEKTMRQLLSNHPSYAGLPAIRHGRYSAWRVSIVAPRQGRNTER
jgi:hypothetical protein